MKKFNTKKIIVSGAVGLALLGGGGIAAANHFGAWVGSSNATEIKQDLVAIDGLLTANENEISTLNGIVTTLTSRVSELENLAAANTSTMNNLTSSINQLLTIFPNNVDGNADLSTKLIAVKNELDNNKQFAGEVDGIFKEVEGFLKVTPVSGETVQSRFAHIKEAAAKLGEQKAQTERDLATAKTNLENSKAQIIVLTTEKATLQREYDAEKLAKEALQTELNGKNSDNDDLQRQLNAAKEDVETIESQTKGIIQRHSK